MSGERRVWEPQTVQGRRPSGVSPPPSLYPDSGRTRRSTNLALPCPHSHHLPQASVPRTSPIPLPLPPQLSWP